MNDRIKTEIRIQALEKLGAIDWEIKGLLWSDVIINTSSTPITESKFNDKIKELEVEYTANQFQRDRVTEYPAITDQLDEIYHNGIDSWKAVIKITKDKYPKG